MVINSIIDNPSVHYFSSTARMLRHAWVFCDRIYHHYYRPQNFMHYGTQRLLVYTYLGLVFTNQNIGRLCTLQKVLQSIYS